MEILYAISDTYRDDDLLSLSIITSSFCRTIIWLSVNLVGHHEYLREHSFSFLFFLANIQYTQIYISSHTDTHLFPLVWENNNSGKGIIKPDHFYALQSIIQLFRSFNLFAWQRSMNKAPWEVGVCLDKFNFRL